MENTKHSRWFKFWGILFIIFGAIFILYGAGSFLAPILQGDGLPTMSLVGVFLLAAGILKILAIKKLWQNKKTGITLFALNEILFIFALGAFYSEMEENWILIAMGTFLIIGVSFMIYFKKTIPKV